LEEIARADRAVSAAEAQVPLEVQRLRTAVLDITKEAEELHTTLAREMEKALKAIYIHTSREKKTSPKPNPNPNPNPNWKANSERKGHASILSKLKAENRNLKEEI